MTQDNFPDWHAHEEFTADLLGADQTVTSGNKFYDIADVVTRGHILDDNIQFMADSKSTLRNSYRIEKAFLRDFRERAILRGKTFLLPVRFEDKYTGDVEDWVVIHANDFSELLALDTRKDAKEQKALFEERSKQAISSMSSIAEKLESLLLDKTISSKSRKALLDLLDNIDNLTVSMVSKK